MAAKPASRSQERVAQYRDVIVPANESPALRAVGARRNHRLVMGKADNAHVQKAAEYQSKERGNQVRSITLNGHSRFDCGTSTLMDHYRNAWIYPAGMGRSMRRQ